LIGVDRQPFQRGVSRVSAGSGRVGRGSETPGAPRHSAVGVAHHLTGKEITMKKMTVRKAGAVRLTTAAASAYCTGTVVV
jgi:hypothetical protein